MPIENLPPVLEVAEPPPFAGPDHPLRVITRRAAFEERWDSRTAQEVAELFNALAPEWDTPRRSSVERLAGIEDALARGSVGAGRALELGSGTGTGTRLLAEHGFSAVIALDLARDMLAIASPELGSRVRGDSSKLPVSSESVDLVVLVNAMLFPAEVGRVLRSDGRVMWVNTVGDQTPIHLPPEDVAEALPGDWTGVASRAGTGTWAVLHRA